ncbi:hypothetical protein Tco_0888375 [Tanacetum coccineum]
MVYAHPLIRALCQNYVGIVGSRSGMQKGLLDWDEKSEEVALYVNDHRYIDKRENGLNGRDIKQAALNHYAARFKESSVHRPLLESNLFRKLSALEASLLESDFSIEEVKDAVWDCAGSKAPGPDGFNFTFIKAFRDVLKFDFWNCIRHFEITGALKKGDFEAAASSSCKLEESKSSAFPNGFVNISISVNWILLFLLDVYEANGFWTQVEEGEPHFPLPAFSYVDRPSSYHPKCFDIWHL